MRATETRRSAAAVLGVLCIAVMSASCRDSGDAATATQADVAQTLASPPLPPTRADEPARAPLVVLVPSDDDVVTHAIAGGIRDAFDAARADGGPSLELRVATRAAAWGSAVEAAVLEAHDANALAIVAPPERRHAHLLAQFATRVRMPLLSTSPARTVAAAGSTWVLPVVPGAAAVGDGPPPAPLWDAAAPEDADASPWARAGLAAGRAAVAAVRANGLRRSGFIAAAGAAGEPPR